MNNPFGGRPRPPHDTDPVPEREPDDGCKVALLGM